ncbi:hypothetical protein K438DRAFT_2163915 [Mycena galopus ATCC 62051]|nr:hypothetical protein K438DRAFT_2163915 [Mycena galopus ATCC 62051]
MKDTRRERQTSRPQTCETRAPGTHKPQKNDPCRNRESAAEKWRESRSGNAEALANVDNAAFCVGPPGVRSSPGPPQQTKLQNEDRTTRNTHPPPQRSGSFAIPQSASDIQPVVPPRGHDFFWWMSWEQRSLRNYCELKKEKILTLALHPLTRGKHGRRIPARGAAEGDLFFLVDIDVAGREPVKLNYITAPHIDEDTRSGAGRTTHHCYHWLELGRRAGETWGCGTAQRRVQVPCTELKGELGENEGANIEAAADSQVADRLEVGAVHAPNIGVEEINGRQTRADAELASASSSWLVVWRWRGVVLRRGRKARAHARVCNLEVAHVVAVASGVPCWVPGVKDKRAATETRQRQRVRHRAANRGKGVGDNR